MTDASARPLELPAGTLFAGDFAVEFKLGEGGMGAVYAVLQRSTGVRRALKVMGGAVLQNPRAWERFEQEARVCARIRSEHVVKVITAGIEPQLRTPFLVMELLEGETLDARLQRGPVAPAEARVVLSQLCHGLAEMHALGIVHRDVKPENIFIARSHRVDVPFTVKLLDFGLAKTLSDGSSAGVTQAVGTPRTMAPEQADPRLPISPATDVWALGLTAFHLLSGRSFWLSANHADGTLQGLLAELLNLPIPPPSERLAQLHVPLALPDGFDGWLLRCLARDPSARFPDAAAAWAALAPALGDDAPALSSAPGTPSSGAGLLGPTTPLSLGAPRPDLPFAETAPPPAQGWTPALAGATPVSSKVAFAETAQPATLRTGELVKPRPRALIALAAGAGVALALGVAALLWARERTVYCRELLMRRGDVACIDEVTPELARRRSSVYRLHRARGKARAAERVNGSGFPSPEEAGVAAWSYRYGAGGALRQVDLLDEHRRLIVRMELLEGTARFLVLGADGRRRLFPGAHFDAEEMTFDAQGRVTQVRYTSGKGAYAADGHGAFGLAMEFDERGRVRARTTLGPDGKPSHDARWIERLERRHDARGNLVEERFLSHQGRPMRSKDGCASLDQQFDEAGNVVQLRCLDADGKPAFHLGGYSGWTARHDERGNRVEVRRVGTDGATIADRSGVAIERVSHDEQGRAVEVRYFAPDGSPTLNAQGIGGWRARHDERGDLVERTFLDASGAPTFHREGYATARFRHDDRHRITEISYLDPAGRPTFHEEGFAAVRIAHDELDRVIERSFFDTGGRPTLSAEKYASLRVKYDERGLPSEERYLGLDGRPTRTDRWFSAQLHRYDDLGNEVETILLGPDGKPTRHREGYAAVRRRFNARNEVIEWSYFNPEMKPTFSDHGVAVLQVQYDALGRLIGRSNHDTSGRLAPDEDGEIQERYTLDDRGNIAERAFFDAFGKPTASLRAGYSIQRTRHGPQNLPEDVSFLDAEGKPTAGPSGAFVERSRHDDRGNKVELSFFGADGRPIISPKEGAATIRWKHDARGATVEWAYFDVDGRPTPNRDGYAVVRATLDPRGFQIGWSYLGADGSPARFRGYARSTALHDERGRRVEVAYFDETGAPVTPEGKAAPVYRFRHDDRGNTLEESLWGADGKPPERAPVARRLFSYDERDLLTETRPFGPDGQPCRDHLAVRTRYDDRGQRVELAYFDAAGHRATLPSGVSYEELSRDERGHVLERRFLDAAGNLVLHGELKAARLRYSYDDLGRKRGEECFDGAGKLLRTNRFGEQQERPDGPRGGPR